MKKKLIALVLMLALVLTFGLVACNNEAESPKTATAKAYGLVHGAGYVGSVTATVDANGKLSYVHIDEYLFPTSWTNKAMYTAANANYNNSSHANYIQEVVNGSKTAVKYIQIGTKIFENIGTTEEEWKQIGVTTGTMGTPIANLMTYIKPTTGTAANTINSEACTWYGQAVEAGECIVLGEVTSGGYEVTNNAGAQIRLAYRVRAISTNGSINKAYSSYGNATYSWQKNQTALEQFLLANGWDMTFTDSLAERKISSANASAAAYTVETGNTMTSVEIEGHWGSGKVWAVNGISTGATELDAPDYLNLAKAACQAAYDLARA